MMSKQNLLVVLLNIVFVLWTAVAASGMNEYHFSEPSDAYSSANLTPNTGGSYAFGFAWLAGIVIAVYVKKYKYPNNNWLVPFAWLWPFLVMAIRHY